MTEVTIIGGSGYTGGGELIRLLQKHPNVEIKNITSRQYDKTPVNKIHPPYTRIRTSFQRYYYR